MMSNRSSFNLGRYLWYQMKRYSYLLLIFSIIALLCGPLMTYLGIRSSFINETNLTPEYIKGTIYATMAYYGAFTTYFFAGLLGIVFALIFSHFLQSKKQSNFFHFLPVKRSTLLCSQFLLGFVLFTLINVLTLVVTIGVLVSLGGLSSVPWLTMAIHLGQSEIFFLTSFSLSMLAGQLVGNTLSHVFMIGVLQMGVSTLGFVIYGYMQTFFKTFLESTFIDNVMSFSLIMGYVKYFSSEYQHFSYLAGSKVIEYYPYFGLKFMLSMLVVIIVSMVLSLVCYKMRSLERASETLAFKALKLPLKLYLGMISGAVFGLLLYLISERSLVFLGVGIGFGAIILHLFYEMAVNRDVRSISKPVHWLTTVLVIVLTAVFAMVFTSDTFGYDTYIPKQSSVTGISINSDERGQDERYQNDKKFVLSDPKSIEAALKLAEKGVLNKDILNFGSDVIPYSNVEMQRDTTTEKLSAVEAKQQEEERAWFSVTYYLAEGGTASRQYTIPRKDFLKLFSTIYDSKEYRNLIVEEHKANLDLLEEITALDQYFGKETLDIVVKGRKLDEYSEFKKALLSDLANRKLSIYNEDVIAQVNLTYEDGVSTLNVFKNDKALLAFFKKAEGMKILEPNTSFYFNKLPDFSWVIIESYDDNGNTKQKRITTKNQIADLIKNKTISANSNDEVNYHYSVYGELPNGERSLVRYFKTGQAPKENA